MRNISRREFLAIMGAAGTFAAIGCGPDTDRQLVPYLHPPADITPGKPSWFATTCRECPAGCGMIVKNIDGRAIKVEGNPGHPINSGTLCPRGQAALHGLYNPDRFRQPMRKNPNGKFVPATWNEGEALLADRIRDLAEQGKGDKIVFITDLVDGTLLELIEYFLEQTGGGEHIPFHPFAYESLRTANRIVFGHEGIPRYRIDEADFLISFGAGFLETWVSNVEYAHDFAKFHSPGDGKKNYFVYVGPRASMTAANADYQIIVAPGDEYLVALALLRRMVENHPSPNLPPERMAYFRNILAPFTPEAITAATGAPAEVIAKVARRFAEAEKPLALAGGLPFQSARSLETAVAANLLCTVSPGTDELIDFSRLHALSRAARLSDIDRLNRRMRNGDVELLLIHEANPVFTLPAQWKFEESLSRAPMIVSFSSCGDETSRHAHLVLPTGTFLESWGDYVPQSGIRGVIQPVMGNLYDTRDLGDILISAGRKIRGPGQFAPENFLQLMQSSWMGIQERKSPHIPFPSFWNQALQSGGFWESLPKTAMAGFPSPNFAFPAPEPKTADTAFQLTAYPSVLFYDGRMANRMWLHEIPDPLTQATWGGWVEISPADAEQLKIEKGDMVRIRSPHGVLEAPAIPIFTVNPGMLAMPTGQGHVAYGRFADGYPANPFLLFPGGIAESTGGAADNLLTVSIEKSGERFDIAHTDGSYFQHGREIHQKAEFIDYIAERDAGRKPEIDLPLPSGYTPDKDFYPAHTHSEYRWCMVVDLDRCIGCGACVVACYAENNVAVVGRKGVLLGREMSWIRVQRYFDEKTKRPNWLVMLCQHCDNAPCESVCPVYAPHHSVEGLNNQVYNRCFGTRFCSQNDPYKVRRFNWFTYTRPRPLDLQLNPDVTVRQKGVMEKCSFCVQRIVEAKAKARNENRKVRDGDFTTACAQTCPTEALIFGNLKEPDSRVARMINDARTYQVLRYLNTKPAVFYLKKLTMEL